MSTWEIISRSSLSVGACPSALRTVGSEREWCWHGIFPRGRVPSCRQARLGWAADGECERQVLLFPRGKICERGKTSASGVQNCMSARCALGNAPQTRTELFAIDCPSAILQSSSTPPAGTCAATKAAPARHFEGKLLYDVDAALGNRGDCRRQRAGRPP